MAATIHFENAVKLDSDTATFAAPFDGGELTEAEASAALAAHFPPKKLWLGASITTRLERITEGQVVYSHRYPLGD